ncbi:hypothetical protein FJZ31_18360 [Candidatus Poribacteria bacterium]|nr:hypothetical protein [Candidatus Poribacteria bacterium]
MCSKMRMLILLFGLIIFEYPGYIIAQLVPCNLDPSVPSGSDTEWTLRVWLVKDTTGPAKHWYNGYANFEVNPSGGPGDALWTINAAASTWNGASWNGISGDFIFYYIGTTNRLAVKDWHNVVCFDWFERQGEHPPAEAIIQRVATLRPDRIVEVDTVLNLYVPWTPGGYDVQNVATHEFRHWLHLYDLSGPCSEFTEFTMWYGT